MPANELMESLVRPYGPSMPLDTLVRELNGIYHRFEAEEYDGIHPEIHEQLPRFWRQMLQNAERRLNNASWRVLDFGCGTGFEALQLLENVGSSKIEKLVCLDPSPEMLGRCREKILPACPQATFCSAEDQIGPHGNYDLLLTNSLLHHLPDPVFTIRQVLSNLRDGAIWLCGHEPSARFYRNPECVEFYEQYRWRRKARALVSPGRLIAGLARRAGVDSTPGTRTAAESFRRGYFRKKPTSLLIDRLVDFHVAHSALEAKCGRGLDIRGLQEELSDQLSLVTFDSYNFLGPYYETGLTNRWAGMYKAIEEKYPEDGANFCAVWIKK